MQLKTDQLVCVINWYSNYQWFFVAFFKSLVNDIVCGWSVESFKGLL